MNEVIIFANPFTDHYKVYLINVRGAGNSANIENDEQLSFEEIVKDLEAIREASQLKKWAFAVTQRVECLHFNMQ